MTVNEAKEYLGQAFYLDRRINLDITKIESMKTSLYGRGANYEKDGTQRVSCDNSVENAICKVLDYEKQINKEIDELIDKKLEIENSIKSLSDAKLREVLERRYLLYQKWEQIAVDMHFTERRVFQLHGKALQKISLNFSVFV